MIGQQFSDLFRRVTSMINRNVVARVENKHKNQLIYTFGLYEQEKLVEVIEPYGLTAWPVEDEQAEMIRYSVNGVEDHSLALCASGGKYRPRYAEYGEVIAYSYLDEEDNHRVHLKKDRVIDIYSSSKVKTIMTPQSIEHDVHGSANIMMRPSYIKLDVAGTAKTVMEPELIEHDVTGTANIKMQPSEIKLNVTDTATILMQPDFIQLDVAGTAKTVMQPELIEHDVTGTANVKIEPSFIKVDTEGTGVVTVEPKKIKASINNDVFIQITDTEIQLNVKGQNILTMTAGGTDWLMKDYEAHNV
ncbi:MAG: hypothetical protein ACRBHB_18150 [Arenicella sp.]